MTLEETFEKINIAKDAMISQKQSMESMVVMSENLHNISSEILNKVTQINLLSYNTDKVSANVEEKIKVTVQQINQINKRTEDILEHMNFLNKLSEEIINIIDILNDISEQTHILSINAAIEATRTGKEARAFTVIANEIRKLSDKSSNSVKTVESMINQFTEEMKNLTEKVFIGVKETEKGVEEIQNTTLSFIDIKQSIHELNIQNDYIQNKAIEMKSITEKMKENSAQIAKRRVFVAEGLQSSFDFLSDIKT